MNDDFQCFYRNNESGQSLIEMVIVLPLFFMILSGFIFVFQQLIRSFSDEMAKSALVVTEAHFDKEERMKAEWSNVYEDSQEIFNKVAKSALNPSSFFNQSVDTKNKVFMDKKFVKQEMKHSILPESCSLDALYRVVVQGNGVFELKTCAPGNAYESLDSKFMPDFIGKSQSMFGSSLYYPHTEFNWLNRPFEVSRAVASFSASPLGVGFSNEQASLFIPDNGYFNKRCFMEPFDPDCSLKPIAGKFSRAARVSSRLQVTSCSAEAALSCATTTGPALLACLVLKAKALKSALMSGVESWVCPNTNIALKESQNVIQKTVYAYSSYIIGRETSLRGEILINN
jgi:hypothetical protein